MVSPTRITNQKGKGESLLEERVLTAFKRFGLVPYQQYWIGYFRVDFAFPEKKLVVEVDGTYCHWGQRERDDFREKKIIESGWSVERFPGKMVWKMPEIIPAKIIIRYFKSDVSDGILEMAETMVAVFFSRQDCGNYGKLGEEICKKLDEKYQYENTTR